MEDKIGELIEFLPTPDELLILTESFPEARYILDAAQTFFKKFKENLMSDNTRNVCNEEEYQEIFYLIESLADKTWEVINIGHFSNVPLNVRRIFTISNWFKILFQLIESSEQSNIEKCNELLDKSILVGCVDDIYSRSTNFIEKLSKFLEDSTDRRNIIELPYIEPLPHKENTHCDIKILASPSLENFFINHFKPNIPVLLKNCISHWPALLKWRDLNYLLKVAGNRIIPVEIGSTYTTDDWSQDMMKFKDFLKRQFGSENSSFNEIEYLAQHDLFDQIPILKDDIKIPEYCCTSLNHSNETPIVDIKAWIGPAGTISPLHQDPKNNILCQVIGEKKIVLASSEHTASLYPYESEFLSNSSQIDAENIDYIRFPKVKDVKFYHLTLQEGECLYIPPNYWHYVKSLTKSFSVSFWWE